ncbi:MAG: hypothetical protein F4204_09175 [Rhodospirillaceae bacterium]|nr:hypothetical protein [Rhodospirillaceae bacterium]
MQVFEWTSLDFGPALGSLPVVCIMKTGATDVWKALVGPHFRHEVQFGPSFLVILSISAPVIFSSIVGGARSSVADHRSVAVQHLYRLVTFRVNFGEIGRRAEAGDIELAYGALSEPPLFVVVVGRCPGGSGSV